MWEARLVAACLWAGPLAAASHEAAALLWELPSFRQRLLVVTTTRAVRKRGLIVHNRKLLTPDCVSYVGAVPVTRPERTLVDIAATHPEEILEASLDDMLIRACTTLEKVGAYREQHEGLAGIRRLATLIDKRGNVPPNHTILETLSTRVVRRFSLPTPRRQVPIYDGDERIKRVDLAYSNYKVVIEPDGGRWHLPRQQRDSVQGLIWLRLHGRQWTLSVQIGTRTGHSPRSGLPSTIVPPGRLPFGNGAYVPSRNSLTSRSTTFEKSRVI
jgi:hypothetical protein